MQDQSELNSYVFFKETKLAVSFLSNQIFCSDMTAMSMEMFQMNEKSLL